MQKIPENSDYYMERTIKLEEKNCMLQMPKRSQDAAENAAYQLHRLLRETVDFSQRWQKTDDNVKAL